jgi:hypothetical protein
LTHNLESLSYHYERNPKDPRISHQLNLEVDEFGNVRKRAAIGYGRLKSDLSTAAGRDQQNSKNLADDRWAIRVWQAEKWVKVVLQHFYAKDITTAKVFLWAADELGENEGNTNLTQFYRDGCIENGKPRRYEEIKLLNDGLRQRGREALIAYLTQLNRTDLPLPGGGYATEFKHLSELLLLDVEAGLCQKASRIEEAISAVQLFVQRARLGLELRLQMSSDFALAWDRHFATFHIWETCNICGPIATLRSP